MSSMVTFSLLSFTISCYILFSSSIVSSEVDEVTLWCKETPNEEACTRYVSIQTDFSVESGIQHKSAFRELSIEAALKKALDVESQLYKQKSKCRNPQQLTVWSDCTKLHASTIRHLNSTLQCLKGTTPPTMRCTDFDAQTWLSSALTNVETCRAGSTDLNMPNFIAPMIKSSNLSDLITNTLAVNGAMLAAEEKENIHADDQLLPVSTGRVTAEWRRNDERKLLEGSIASLIVKSDTVVAKDGSGNFKTVQAAVDLAAKRDDFREKFIIRVKKGVYEETIEVLDSNHNVWLVGDGIGVTIITGNRSVGSGNYTTFSSATAGIDGARFVARGITFRNTAGPEKRQAVALRSASDLAVFYQCSFQGYQDTLFIQTQRQFFRECHLSGTVDFIFGNAAAVFQNCLIFVRRPMDGQINTITAQGRQNSFEHTGFSIHGSKILPSPELKPVADKFPTYLGRPWMRYSRTVVMKSYMDGIVSPDGWSKWGGTDFALNSLYFGEYNNTGAGACTDYRVKWRGFHVINDDVTAKQFTVNGLYAGRSWLPSTGVPFSGDL
ncbi:Probable pectinesterase/pectinesterase inhibitor 59 [Linum grandiflorum]